MKTMKRNKRRTKVIFRILILGLLLGFLSQCRQDDDMNYRILVDNHCEFALKVYYDNQDIEHYENGTDVDVTGSVSFIPAYGTKKIHSKYKSVWVEPEYDNLRPRKFKSVNDGSWRKSIDIYEMDFNGR